MNRDYLIGGVVGFVLGVGVALVAVGHLLARILEEYRQKGKLR